MKYPRYPVYRESGAPWLGEIPAHWEVKRLKFLLTQKLEYGANEVANDDDPDMPRYIRITDIDEAGNLRDDTFKSLPIEIARPYLLKDKDILLARSGATVGKTFIYRGEWGDAAYAGYMIRARCKATKLLPDFLAYFTQSPGYWQWIASNQIQATIQNVSAEKYAGLSLSLPAPHEQRAIADFLDRETAKIDALVAKKRELIERLKEKRAALITHAVTKGLNTKAPMKDSGVPWLGKIPAHWRQTKLRYVATMRGGLTPSTSNGEYWGGVMPWVTPKDMKVPLIADAEDHITEIALAETRLEVFEPGKVLIVVRGMILAHTFPVAMNTVAITVNQDMKALDCGSGIIPAFLYWLLRGLDTLILNLVEDSAHGTKVLRTDQLQGMTLYLPPRKEQEKIVSVLKASVEKYKFLIHVVEIAIATLNEHRAALISAAVTGKIDVREAMRKAA